MLLDFLPMELLQKFNQISLDKLYSIRLRRNNKIILNYDNTRYYLSNNGLSTIYDEGVICDQYVIDEIINFVTESSIYAFNDKIKNCFLTTKQGVRIGISGECVYNDDKIVTIKNIHSLNVRIPHFIDNCSNKIFSFISNKIINVLLISKPGQGKTTILKDLIIKIDKLNLHNVLVVDERGEFAELSGENVDKISYATKEYAINYGVRSLSPDVIIMDELSNYDISSLENVTKNGVKIIATLHGESIFDYKAKFNNNSLFDYYFILDSNKVGEVYKIYDKEFNEI